VTLGNLDRYEDALAAAGQARYLADQVGTTIRLAQAHCALGQLLFQVGRWDEALAQVGILPENLKPPTGACCDLGTAAMISFHRGEIDAARGHLAAAVPHAQRIGRLITPLALARSLDREQDGALAEALAALTEPFADSTEEIEDLEDLFADAVRLAVATGREDTARTVAGQAAALAAESQIPHRQASALYCGGLLDRDASRLLAAAERYDEAGRPLLRAKALEAAARHLVRAGDRGQAQATLTRAVEVYTGLSAAGDIARVQATFG
jgi:tetratricopeptide (TPR) repeat protein